MADALPSIEDKAMLTSSDTHTHEPAWFSSVPPRHLLGAVIAYVSAVSVGVAAVAAVATAGASF